VAETIFTQREQKIMQLRLSGSSNREIAEELNVTDPAITQTFRRIRKKIRAIKDSSHLLMQLGIMETGPDFRLTETGLRKMSLSLPEMRHISSQITRMEETYPITLKEGKNVSERIFLVKNLHPATTTTDIVRKPAYSNGEKTDFFSKRNLSGSHYSQKTALDLPTLTSVSLRMM